MGKISITTINGGARRKAGPGLQRIQSHGSKIDESVISLKKSQILSGKITKSKKKKPLKEGKAKFVKQLVKSSKELDIPLRVNIDGKSIKKEFKKKKDRVEARKIIFQKQVESIKLLTKEALKSLKRQETPVVGDMNPLLEALDEMPKVPENKDKNDLKRLQQSSSTIQNRNRKKKNKNKSKKQQIDIAQGLKYFQGRLQKN